MPAVLVIRELRIQNLQKHQGPTVIVGPKHTFAYEHYTSEGIRKMQKVTVANAKFALSLKIR
jgi:hypothetical protein